MKYLISFSLMAFILIITTSQVNKSSTPKTSSCDSSITFKEILQFNAFLKTAASYDQYSKLTPEATLTELWNWKLKLLSDTTKKK